MKGFRTSEQLHDKCISIIEPLFLIPAILLFFLYDILKILDPLASTLDVRAGRGTLHGGRIDANGGNGIYPPKQDQERQRRVQGCGGGPRTGWTRSFEDV